MVDYFDYMVGWVCCYEGEIIFSDCFYENIFVFKKFIGVIIGILFWNFFFFLIVCKVVFVLLMGNIIVVKLSQLILENVYVFVQIVDEVGLFKGVFNLVNGCGLVIGYELVVNFKVGMVSLIGSVEVGIQIMVVVFINVMKVFLELGGKVFGIVMLDVDLDLVVKFIIVLCVINIGQVCNCCECVYVYFSIKEVFFEKLLVGFKQVKVGDLNQYIDFDMGLLIDVNVLKLVEEKVEKVIEQGVELLCGGYCIGIKGYFFELMILINCI